MASKKKESEGIALLSMYNDEDDEMEDLDEADAEEEEYKTACHREDDSNNKDSMATTDSAQENTPPLAIDDSTPKSNKFGPLSPSHSQPPQSSPLPQPPTLELQKHRKGKVTIVDYGHDEVAMSPEAEEGEIVTTSWGMSDPELQTINGDVLEKSTPGTIQVLTPSIQATPQSSDQLDLSHSDTLNNAVIESEPVGADEAFKTSLEAVKDVDLLDKFLPLPLKTKCSEELQEKINKFLAYKRFGKSFNAEVRNRKDYRNPDFLLHAVRYQDIDQIGSCFSKDVFDPHGFDKSDYYDAIEVDMKREMERREQEKKKNQKVEFVPAGSQPGSVAAASKINLPMPGVSTVAASGLPSVPTAADVGSRDARQNKKSKWDKVDGDRRNPVPPAGQDSASAVGGHAALLSAANAGAGYTAFAQQRRREAEEKRSSERKLDRRS
ncbi:uncharacterized protein LOC131158282 isoform X2 [Malania oleifera]|uniref:uncharacterized protein LOC131158282 isoform X2 n=1 Tax=Malania oleifera TaxID=397392 RepID=UPI0025AE05F7|nr:uncharacterized protein LOC131158282 isoform X2 [Malania oleifera]XP_057969020.1 uncharacterized protein LOC131158282 isoform X2 [Malania oleifera]XP_057969021.1 uncharacterized protein LOC131158282 isoform X2 [Malania oleifera]XP_057969022.1 uncharacterized protein LOC131158282 isoform X2 [Malania oleifera]